MNLCAITLRISDLAKQLNDMNTALNTEQTSVPHGSLHPDCSAAGGQERRARTWKCGCGLSADELHKINWVRYVQGYAQCKQCHHDLEEY